MKHTIGLKNQYEQIWALVLVFATLLSPALSRTALLVIDVQKCFLPGGSLSVTDGEDVIPVINNIRRKYRDQISMTVFSQDWHCQNHVSFASQHGGYDPYSIITLRYDINGKLCGNQCDATYSVNQTLWPDHCVINRTDAEFSSGLNREPDDIVVRKGYNCEVDSYSAFYDNGGFSKTELEELLRGKDITTVIVTGLALDFCVYYTSRDARKIGFDVYTVIDASRPVDPANVPKVLEDLGSLGVHVINSSDLDQVVSSASLPKYLDFYTVLLFLLASVITLILSSKWLYA